MDPAVRRPPHFLDRLRSLRACSKISRGHVESVAFHHVFTGGHGEDDTFSRVPSRCFSEFSSLKVRLEQDIIGHRAGLKGEGLVDDSGPAQCYGLVVSFLKENQPCLG